MGKVQRCREGCMEELPCSHLERSAPLPTLNAQMLRESATSFKRRTGLGCDHGHPRTFGWLSDEILEDFATLLMSIETSGLWPQQVSTILIALIQKKPEEGSDQLGSSLG